MEKINLMLDKYQVSVVKASLWNLKSDLDRGIIEKNKNLAHCKRAVSDPIYSKGYEQVELDNLEKSIDGLERVIYEKRKRLKAVNFLLVELG
tara:strand:- start:1919 stop:2194 length:276 start_codon:yes stop_codon:yes gene_type:complete